MPEDLCMHRSIRHGLGTATRGPEGHQSADQVLQLDLIRRWQTRTIAPQRLQKEHVLPWSCWFSGNEEGVWEALSGCRKPHKETKKGTEPPTIYTPVEPIPTKPQMVVICLSNQLELPSKALFLSVSL